VLAREEYAYGPPTPSPRRRWVRRVWVGFGGGGAAFPGSAPPPLPVLYPQPDFTVPTAPEHPVPAVLAPGDVGHQGMLGTRGCWAPGDVGHQGMLGTRGCWAPGDQGMLGTRGCWAPGDVGQPKTPPFPDPSSGGMFTCVHGGAMPCHEPHAYPAGWRA
jgi:hypothetical protein